MSLDDVPAQRAVTTVNQFFVVGPDNFGDLEVAKSTIAGQCVIRNRHTRVAVDDFVVHSSAQVETVCRVRLSSDGNKLLPRFRFFKRSKLADGGAREYLEDFESEGRVQNVRSSVSLEEREASRNFSGVNKFPGKFLRASR